MKYEDVTNLLLEKFPEFKPDEDSIDLPYIVAGDFAEYLMELYKNKSMDQLQKGLDFVELLESSNEHKVKELTTIGFLEGIQNFWGNNGINPEEIYELLGPKSKKMWKELNKFWGGPNFKK